MSELLIWKIDPHGGLIGQDPNVCCLNLYAIYKEDRVLLEFAYAAPDDPIRRDDTFATIADAKAAAEAAYRRLVETKFWGVVLDADAYIPEKRKRHHGPGCQYASAP